MDEVAGACPERLRTKHLLARYKKSMIRKASVVIEKDEHGYYAWCPELKGCQSQGKGLDEAIANIREAIELYLETLTEEERSAALN